jgi:hypothetical protein
MKKNNPQVKIRNFNVPKKTPRPKPPKQRPKCKCGNPLFTQEDRRNGYCGYCDRIDNIKSEQ